jgi:urea carboxylase-associated protein 2
MAGTVVPAMPTIPPSSANDIPESVSSADMVWAETVGAGGYASRVLRRGTRLRLTDLEGDACVGILVYNASNPIERLNVADTTKVQWNAYLGEGSLLLSDMGRVLMSLVRDTSGNHDTLAGTSNERLHVRKYGEGANHSPFPSGRDRFLLALAKHGLTRRDLIPNVNFFKEVRIGGDGGMTLVHAEEGAGRFVELRAEMDVLVVVVNCPHVLDDRPSYNATPVRALAWRGSPAGDDDPIRNASPEALRAFQNTEDYLIG